MPDIKGPFSADDGGAVADQEVTHEALEIFKICPASNSHLFFFFFEVPHNAGTSFHIRELGSIWSNLCDLHMWAVIAALGPLQAPGFLMHILPAQAWFKRLRPWTKISNCLVMAQLEH